VLDERCLWFHNNPETESGRTLFHWRPEQSKDSLNETHPATIPDSKSGGASRQLVKRTLANVTNGRQTPYVRP
jgi:hypothetical protein